MPFVPFDQIEDAPKGGAKVLKPGKYLAQCTKVIPRQGKEHQQWMLIYDVIDKSSPEYGNSFVDNIFWFSDKGEAATKQCMSRVKLICKALGMDVTQAQEITEDSFIGKIAKLTLKQNGEYLNVTFDGYEAVEGADGQGDGFDL